MLELALESLHLLEYSNQFGEYNLLVAGIGVTPFASILKSIWWVYTLCWCLDWSHSICLYTQIYLVSIHSVLLGLESLHLLLYSNLCGEYTLCVGGIGVTPFTSILKSIWWVYSLCGGAGIGVPPFACILKSIWWVCTVRVGAGVEVTPFAFILIKYSIVINLVSMQSVCVGMVLVQESLHSLLYSKSIWWVYSVCCWNWSHSICLCTQIYLVSKHSCWGWYRSHSIRFYTHISI